MVEVAIVYLAAGLSSRFGGKVKQFAKVGPEEESLIEYSLNQALKSNFNKIVFIVGEKTEKQFREKFGESYKGVPVLYASQEFDKEKRERPWGTIDATCCVEQVIDCPFVVCNSDDIYGENSFRILFDNLKNEKGDCTIGYELDSVMPKNGEVNRGIFSVENEKVLGLKEELGINRDNLEERRISLNDLCSMNLFGFTTDTLKLLREKLSRFKEENKEDRKIECLLPNEINSLIKESRIEMSIYPATDQWFGVTNPEDEEIVRKQLKEIN